MPIASRIFLAFCLVLVVVLTLGLWSLQSTRELLELTSALVSRGLPAARLEITLSELCRPWSATRLRRCSSRTKATRHSTGKPRRRSDRDSMSWRPWSTVSTPSERSSRCAPGSACY